MERHILREGTSSCPISSSGSHIFFLQAVSSEKSETPLISCVSLARLPILCSLSKSDSLLIPWSPSGYTPVGPGCPDTLSSPCLLITMWQLVKAHGVTRNELKIHVICYITLSPQDTIQCLNWVDGYKFLLVFISLSSLLRQYPIYFVCLVWMVWVRVGK